MTHSELIEELGGATKLANALLTAPGGGDVDRDAIYKWSSLDRIPWRWRAPVAAVARAQGKALPDDFIPGVDLEATEAAE